MHRRAAKQTLLHWAEQYGHVYKIHGPEGEFVQAGPHAFWEVDEERILLLEALVELIHDGRLSLLSDSQQLTSYEISQPRFPRLDDDEKSPDDNLYSLSDREPPAEELQKSA
jgi:hypothetical protein